MIKRCIYFFLHKNHVRLPQMGFPPYIISLHFLVNDSLAIGQIHRQPLKVGFNFYFDTSAKVNSYIGPFKIIWNVSMRHPILTWHKKVIFRSYWARESLIWENHLVQDSKKLKSIINGVRINVLHLIYWKIDGHILLA